MKKFFSSRNGVSLCFPVRKGAGDCHYNQSGYSLTEMEMVEISMAEITGKLQFPIRHWFVLDENGSEPYQITYDDMLIFPVFGERGCLAVYTTSRRNSHSRWMWLPGVYPERSGWCGMGNDRAAYPGPVLLCREGRACLMLVMTSGPRAVPEPVDQIVGETVIWTACFIIDHGKRNGTVCGGPTLGGGTAALFPDSTIVYPYCYKDCEVLDNGPLDSPPKFIIRWL